MSDSIMTDHDMDSNMVDHFEIPHRVSPWSMDGVQSTFVRPYRAQHAYRVKHARLRVQLPNHPNTSLRDGPMSAEEARIVARHNEHMLFLEQYNLQPIIIRKRVFDDEKLSPVPDDLRRRQLSDADDSDDMDVDGEGSSSSLLPGNYPGFRAFTPPLPSSPRVEVGHAASLTEQQPGVFTTTGVEQDIQPERLIWRGQWMPCHKVAHICRRVQRGLRRTVTTTVQAAVEVVDSVKRRAFGIENKQQSPRRIGRDSRTRLLQRREEMLIGASPERRLRLRDQWKREDRGLPPSPTASVPSSPSFQPHLGSSPIPSPSFTPTASSSNLTLMSGALAATSSTQPESDDTPMGLDDPTVPDHVLQPTSDVTPMVLDDPTVLDHVPQSTHNDATPMALDASTARSRSRSLSPCPSRQELSGNTGVTRGSPKQKSPTKSKGILKHTQDGRIEKQKNHKSPLCPSVNGESRRRGCSALPWFNRPEVPRMSLEELLQPVLEEYALLEPYGRYMTPSTQLQTELTSHANQSILESPNSARRLALFRNHQPSSSTAEHVEVASSRQPDHDAYHHASNLTSHAYVDTSNSTHVNADSVRLDQSSYSSSCSYLAPTPTLMVGQSAFSPSAAQSPTHSSGINLAQTSTHMVTEFASRAPSAAHSSGSHLAPAPAQEAGESASRAAFGFAPSSSGFSSAPAPAQQAGESASQAARLSGSHLAPTPAQQAGESASQAARSPGCHVASTFTQMGDASHAASAAVSFLSGSHLAPTATHFVEGSASHPVSASANVLQASHDDVRSHSPTSRPSVQSSTTSSDAVSGPITAAGQAVEPEFDYPMRPELAPWLQRPRPSCSEAVRSDTDLEALEQQLSTATVADEQDERSQREQQVPGHRPLSVHWLESLTPLGRPVSSVRLFNPESPAVPGVQERSRAIHHAQWEASEQRRATRARTRDQRPRRARVASGQAVRPLSQQWEARVADAMSAPPNRQLATTLNGDPLTRRDLASCHTPMAWLNDEVINAYLAIVVDYLRHASGNAGRLDRPKFHAFNSFFYSNLRDKGYDSVRRWAGRAKIGGEALLEVDTVFIPVHQNAHWTLLVVRPASRTIEYFDSLGSRSQAFATNVKRWLRGELRDLYKDEEWSVLPTASSQQDNGSDCGVFLLTTAKAVAVGLEPSVYGPSDITTLRKKIVAELMNGGLEGDFDPAGRSSESRL